MHLIREDGQPVAAIQWAACAYHLKDREAWIGWNAQTCARRRNLSVKENQPTLSKEVDKELGRTPFLPRHRKAATATATATATAP